jgi:hypothetical protein
LIPNAETVTSKKPVRKEFLQNLGVLFLSCLVCLVVGEILVRLLFPGTLKLHATFPQGVLCKPDPLLGWIGRPNGSGVWSYRHEDMDDMHVSMNSEGFWDTSRQTRKPESVKRLLFLGDSFTIGLGITREERFSDLIKDRLTSGYEVLNMGMWGYSTDQELLLLEEKGLKYDPDVIILSMFLDDLFCSKLFSVNDGVYIKPRFSLAANEDLELHNVPVPNNHGRSALLNMILTRYYKFRNRLEVGEEFDRLGWISVFDKAYWRRDGYNIALRLLSEMETLSEAHGIKFLLVVVPDKDQLYEQQIYADRRGYQGIPPERLDLGLPQKVVNLFCGKMGIPVLDLLPTFREYGVDEKLFFENDLHWTRAGHRLAAEEILACLRKLNYL